MLGTKEAAWRMECGNTQQSVELHIFLYSFVQWFLSEHYYQAWAQDWGGNGTRIPAENLVSFPLPIHGAAGLGTPVDGGAVFARKSTGDWRWQGRWLLLSR